MFTLPPFLPLRRPMEHYSDMIVGNPEIRFTMGLIVVKVGVRAQNAGMGRYGQARSHGLGSVSMPCSRPRTMQPHAAPCEPMRTHADPVSPTNLLPIPFSPRPPPPQLSLPTSHHSPRMTIPPRPTSERSHLTSWTRRMLTSRTCWWPGSHPQWRPWCHHHPCEGGGGD